MKSYELLDKRFGKLTVIKRCGSVNGYSRWKCRCDCSRETTVNGSNLVNGYSTSCGHHKPRGTNKQHGHAANTNGVRPSSEYKTWSGMIRRCMNPNDKDFCKYGGRGICVTPQWRESFAVFLLDMGLKPSPQHSIDRIDVDGNYEPSNCRWATWKQQANNRRKRLRIEQFTYEELIHEIEKRNLVAQVETKAA